jgi:hypothetical protein
MKVPENLRWNEKVASVFNHLLVFLMMLCLALTAQQFLTRLLPGAAFDYLVLVVAIVVIEAIWAARSTSRLVSFGPEWFVYRVTELILFMMGAKLVTYVGRGLDALRTDLVLWQEGFMNNFFTPDYLGVFVLLGSFWILGTAFGRFLLQLEGDEVLYAFEEQHLLYRDRRATLRRLVGWIFSIGAIMLFLAAGARYNSPDIWGDLPPVEGSTWNILAYFLLGLLLISQSQFAVLRAVWSWKHVDVQPSLASSWIQFSLVFLGGLALLVLILPTGYSVGILDMVRYLLAVIAGIINWFLMLFTAPLSDPVAIEQTSIPQQALTPQPMFPQLPTQLDTYAGVNPIWDFWRSLLFWVIFGSILYWALVFYLRQQEELWARIRAFPVMRTLRQLWDVVRTWFRGVQEKTNLAFEEGRKRLRERFPAQPKTSRRRGLFAWRRLSARDQVRFFYLALVRRGQESGVPRKPSQTPLEYADHLRDALPESEDEITTLTQGFIEARYTQKTVDATLASTVKAVWRKLQTALRRRKRDKNP